MTDRHFGPIKPGGGLLIERLNRRIRSDEILFTQLQSIDFVTGSTGFRIQEDGTAEFLAGMTIGGGADIDDVQITGELSIATGGSFKTGLTGERIEITAAGGAAVISFESDVASTTAGSIVTFADQMALRSTGLTANARGGIDINTTGAFTHAGVALSTKSASPTSLEIGVSGDSEDKIRMKAANIDIMKANIHGMQRPKVATLFPNEEISNPANTTSFTTASTFITITTITLHTHSADTTVAVEADCNATWGEAGAVAYNNFIKMGISLDGGSSWTDSDLAESFLGSNSGAVFRDNISISHYLEGTATGDVQVRMQYQVENTGTDRLNNITLRGRVEQTF